MKYYITVDGGTTNTRINLVCEKTIIQSAKISIGAKDCIDGSDKLKEAISREIDNICLQNSIKTSELVAVIASGMITSEYGLCTLAHLCAPAGITELHDGIKKCERMFGELDCYFIPGVKLVGDDALHTDMMRGEEAEIMGVLSSEYKNAVYILPGSHSKHIYLDGQNRISTFRTMLTGEMISALTNGTILKATVRLDTDGFDEKALLEGYDAATSLGINDALFKVRIMKNLFAKSDVECYSFFLGAVMQAEVASLKNSGASLAVIGGKGQLRESLAAILKNRTPLKTVTLDDKTTEAATAVGAIRIFEKSVE